MWLVEVACIAPLMFMWTEQVWTRRLVQAAATRGQHHPRLPNHLPTFSLLALLTAHSGVSPPSQVTPPRLGLFMLVISRPQFWTIFSFSLVTSFFLMALNSICNTDDF